MTEPAEELFHELNMVEAVVISDMARMDDSFRKKYRKAPLIVHEFLQKWDLLRHQTLLDAVYLYRRMKAKYAYAEELLDGVILVIITFTFEKWHTQQLPERREELAIEAILTGKNSLEYVCDWFQKKSGIRNST